MKNENYSFQEQSKNHSSFFIFHSSFLYLPLYVVEALADVVWEPPLTLAPMVSPYHVSSVSVMVGEEMT